MERTRRIEESKTFCIEIIKAKIKNILANRSYRQLAGRHNEFEIYLKNFLHKSKNKKSYL